MRKSSCSSAAVLVEAGDGDSFPAVDPIRARAEQLAADAELAERLRSGDVDAAADFYDRVEHVVTGSLLQVLGPGDRDHEDLAQVALERILSSVMKNRYGGRCNLATWASVVTSRVAIDALRRRRHERRIFSRNDEDDDVFVAAPDTDRPDRVADSARSLEALRNALGKISPDKAQTVVLFEVMGHDLTQIAEMTGVSVAAAQSRLVRGRRELKARLVKTLGHGHDR